MHILNEYFDKIYITNLDSAKDRYERLSKELDSFGVVYERFKALTPDDARKVFAEKGLKIPKSNSGALGCATSHYICCQQAAKNGLKRILILEDDARITDIDFNQETQNLVEQIRKTDWFYLKLGYNITNQMLDENFEFHRVSENLFNLSKSSMTTAIAFNIEKIVEDENASTVFISDHALENSKLNIHIDHRLFMMCNEFGILQCHYYPAIFTQTDGYSYIGKEERKFSNIDKRTNRIFKEHIQSSSSTKKLF